ncbi:MAG: adenine phosphoribosyltransferase [Phycisphaerales bacterium]|nr:adenine phosphoribosyltransferase [Phycisphaerales bacterium]
MDLKTYIRDVPDFPKPGIVFKDFTPLLASPSALALSVELMANPFRGKGVQMVVGAESRGFIFGIAIAQALSVGFVPIRKPGKLPRSVHGVDYALEYGSDRLEIHTDALAPGTKCVIVDDLLATGGTMRAACQLTGMSGAHIVGIAVLIELAFLKARDTFASIAPVHSVLQY